MASSPMRIGLQIPNFNFPGVGPEDLLDTLTGIATTAESSGFESVWVMDHLNQIPGVGPIDNWMLEGNVALSALAARTSKAHLGLMVGGVTYRNPALLAKMTTTLDVLSGGRAILGLGAAWFEHEHRAFGYDFPPLRERFERLEDALRIARAMFTEDEADRGGHAPQRRGRAQQPAPDPRRHPDHDRRQRRAQDAAAGRPVRRRVQHLRRPRARPPPARRARAATARASAATRRRSRRRKLGTLVDRRDARAGRRKLPGCASAACPRSGSRAS